MTFRLYGDSSNAKSVGVGNQHQAVIIFNTIIEDTNHCVTPFKYTLLGGTSLLSFPSPTREICVGNSINMAGLIGHPQSSGKVSLGRRAIQRW
jgi:hypothetical protein